jgi:RNA polymerase sigma-70 factor (ECF subfamily)
MFVAAAPLAAPPLGSLPPTPRASLDDDAARAEVAPPSPPSPGSSAASRRHEERRFLEELLSIRADLRARALRLTRDPAAADDLVQDALERALRFRAQFQPGTSLRSWAQTIVFSVFVTGFRRRRRERDALRNLTVDPCAWTALESDVVLRRDLSPAVRAALDSLPRGFREVVVLVDLGDQSYRDAAETLGVPVGTVMSRLHRARKALATALAEERAVEAAPIDCPQRAA